MSSEGGNSLHSEQTFTESVECEEGERHPRFLQCGAPSFSSGPPMKVLLPLLALSFVLQACAVYTPSGSVVIDPSGSPGPRGQGQFCPPGQAKKGNC